MEWTVPKLASFEGHVPRRNLVTVGYRFPHDSKKGCLMFFVESLGLMNIPAFWDHVDTHKDDNDNENAALFNKPAFLDPWDAIKTVMTVMKPQLYSIDVPFESIEKLKKQWWEPSYIQYTCFLRPSRHSPHKNRDLRYIEYACRLRPVRRTKTVMRAELCWIYKMPLKFKAHTQNGEKPGIFNKAALSKHWDTQKKRWEPGYPGISNIRPQS